MITQDARRSLSRGNNPVPSTWLATGLGCADPLECLQRLPQENLGLCGVVGGPGAAAQAGRCVCLVPGAGDSAGQFQGLVATPLSLRELTANPVQRPFLVKRLGLATPVAEVAVDIRPDTAPGDNGGARRTPGPILRQLFQISGSCRCFVDRRRRRPASSVLRTAGSGDQSA